VKRWSVDCKATVKIGDFSRGGQTRGDDQALDHDLGCKEKYTPCGIVDEDSAQLAIVFSSSSKTSVRDFSEKAYGYMSLSVPMILAGRLGGSHP